MTARQVLVALAALGDDLLAMAARFAAVLVALGLLTSFLLALVLLVDGGPQ